MTTLPPHPLRVAAAAYPIETHRCWQAFADKLALWVANAARDGAHIATLPEYAGLETAFIGAITPASPGTWCIRGAESAGSYAALCATLAQKHALTLLSGSLPVKVQGDLVNRAYLCGPNGQVLPIDKQILTPWERAETPLCPGPALPAVATEHGRLAALICYDGEFPPLARALAPDILLMPACTEGADGDARLRAAARARALEAQAVTVHAPLLGHVPACPIVDANTGRAGIYAPPDTPFPSDGTLAEGVPDTPGWVTAEVESGALTKTRAHGAVAPRAHMAEAEARAARVMSG
ncbi:MAG: nitrilase-related carbon-nitrogen hydrolase [Pseudomonadota bacterium]